MIYTLLVKKLQEEILREIIFEGQTFERKELPVIKKVGTLRKDKGERIKDK